MKFSGFTEEDFDVFAVDGLDERMEALKMTIRPKLEELGEHFKDVLSEKTGRDMYYHVAKHARRKVNPPDDTWVAFCSSNRGYKKLPHFQIGLFGSHVFVWFAVIYESPVKGELGRTLLEDAESVKSMIPEHYEWSEDHTKPDTVSGDELSNEDYTRLFQRLQDVKKAELLCGKTFCYSEDLLRDGDAFVQEIEKVFDTVLPLYEKSMDVYEQKV
ncbi:YktB family protein [Alkalicoccus chagannorensis]|uniref:YktB family protein n=1 Tax=Alkalicoccus chagannorensis TaxID=427072 RepID=UPI00041005FA|nr:DUF1054 domain-containing protein [Alkalicoccus chagannorensis]